MRMSLWTMLCFANAFQLDFDVHRPLENNDDLASFFTWRKSRRVKRSSSGFTACRCVVSCTQPFSSTSNFLVCGGISSSVRPSTSCASLLANAMSLFWTSIYSITCPRCAARSTFRWYWCSRAMDCISVRYFIRSRRVRVLSDRNVN